jgi:hypothetical protein
LSGLLSRHTNYSEFDISRPAAATASIPSRRRRVDRIETEKEISKRKSGRR